MHFKSKRIAETADFEMKIYFVAFQQRTKEKNKPIVVLQPALHNTYTMHVYWPHNFPFSNAYPYLANNPFVTLEMCGRAPTFISSLQESYMAISL